MTKIWPVMFIVIFLAACSQQDTAITPEPSNTPLSPTIQPTPSLAASDRERAEADYTTLRELHTQISGIWEALQAGRSAQCGEEFIAPEPELMTGDHAVQVELRSAAIDLLSAVNLWHGECQNPRAKIPDEVISRGVLYVRGAGMTLDRVSVMLGGEASP